MKTFPLALALAGAGALMFAATPTVAQPQQQRQHPRMPKMLGDSAPKIGDQLPDVAIYTDSGDPYRTSLLKGKYTVLVVGCLT